jgi:hypothetical protein
MLESGPWQKMDNGKWRVLPFLQATLFLLSQNIILFLYTCNAFEVASMYECPVLFSGLFLKRGIEPLKQVTPHDDRGSKMLFVQPTAAGSRICWQWIKQD